MSLLMPEANAASGTGAPAVRTGRLILERWRTVPLLLLADGLWDGARRWPSFDDWCQAHPHRQCALWLSSHLLHELVCDPELPLRDDLAVLAWAQPQLQHYHGEAASAWALAAWQQGRHRGVSALHGVALQALKLSASRHGVRLSGVRPWWSLVLPLALRRHAVLRGAQARLLVVEGRGVAALDLRRGQLTGLALRRLDDATPQALADWKAEQPGAADVTVAVGYGLAPGAISGLHAGEGLDAAAPAADWLGSGAA